MIYHNDTTGGYERRLITGGPYALERAGEELDLTIDLHWLWEEGEPGSTSITGGWSLDRIQAYDEDGKEWELTPEEETDVLAYFGHP